MSDERKRDTDRERSSLPDYVLACTAVISAVWPPAVLFGAPLALGIERLRGQRFDQFRVEVVRRLERLEADPQTVGARLERDESLVEFLEHGAEAAARSASEDRRAQLAELVARGLTTEEQTADQAKKLLYLLRDLTDEEVIWLIHLGSEAVLGLSTSHHRRHAETLRPASRETGAPRSEVNRRALQDGYIRNLQRLGLIHDAITKPGKENAITGLGILLLEYIGEWSSKENKK